MVEIRYVNQPGTDLLRAPGGDVERRLLLGARVHVDEQNPQNGFLPASLVARDSNGNPVAGFIDPARIADTQQLKVFYLDVGQGDATIVEAEGALVVIDGGPNDRFVERMRDRLEQIRQADEDAGLPRRDHLEISAIIVTHFDTDHFAGLTHLLEDPDFHVGEILHNGLPRFADAANRWLDMGARVDEPDGTTSITCELDGLPSARQLFDAGAFINSNGNETRFHQFLEAALAAQAGQRLQSMRRLRRSNPAGPAEVLQFGDLRFEVLAPLTTSADDRLRAFPSPEDVTATNPHPAPSESHTVNGNSVVLRLRYGTQRFLFGGDLNHPSQRYLAERYGDMTPFEAEVNKACHHGSSDFDLAFLQAVAPHATVFSSGDDGNHDHPLPDAMGAAARHGRGEVPLVFSTELTRERRANGQENMAGHINARSNGVITVMAQKKERTSRRKQWITFPVPYAGPFSGH